MAKFIFKMESILSVKEKLEEQAKAEYSIEMMKLRQEEEKLDKLKLRRDMYQSKLYDAVTDKLNILEIKILEDSVENIKYNIKLQMVVVANQQRAVEKAGEKLDNAMKERKTYEKLKENINPEFNKKLSENISKITNGKYNNILFNDEQGLIVELPNGNYISADRLSIGTIDQIYLSLRLAIIDEITNEKLPIILDEAFAYFDDIRLENIMLFLSKKFKDRQIIIFTCTTRELRILQNNNIEFNFIEL